MSRLSWLTGAGTVLHCWPKSTCIFSQLVQFKLCSSCASFAMKTLILGSLLLVILSSCIHPGFAITALDDETYRIVVQMIEGKFKVLGTKRTTKQNSSRVRFWRNKDKLSLQGGLLCFQGKAIVKKSAMKKVLKKSFKRSKGFGSRKIYHRLEDCYSIVWERIIHKLLSKSSPHQKLNARFENRARLRLIRARDVQIRYQVDLVDMQKLRRKYKDKVFRYVLSVMDVFSCYHWLVPRSTWTYTYLQETWCSSCNTTRARYRIRWRSVSSL